MNRWTNSEKMNDCIFKQYVKHNTNIYGFRLYRYEHLFYGIFVLFAECLEFSEDYWFYSSFFFSCFLYSFIFQGM